MDFALIYLLQRFFLRLADFFHHWYVDGSRNIFHYFISLLENLDQTFALRVTLRHFFQPLYKDYTIVGRILGIIFRSGRVLIAFLFYLVIAAAFAIVYFAWLILPPAILFYAVYRETHPS
ncbi:MAG: hypothetical protein AAB897_03270 [Patescibacteria group bacterium]